MKRFLRKHRPIPAALLVILMLVLSFAILSTDQDWMVFDDKDTRTEVSSQMTKYSQMLDEYDNEEGRKKMESAQAFLARFGAEIDALEVFHQAQFVCRELSTGGISVVSLRKFLELGVEMDEIVTKNIPLEDISFFADTLGFSEASMWIDRFSAILSKTGPALKAYDILFWCMVGIFVLSVLLVLLDTGIGPLLFVLTDVLCCAGIIAVGTYVKQKAGVGLTLAAPAMTSLGLSLGAMILWIILGIISKKRRR